MYLRNLAGNWPLGICNPVITELSGCRTVRQCNPLLILSSQEKHSLYNWCNTVEIFYFFICISTLHITVLYTVGYIYYSNNTLKKFKNVFQGKHLNFLENYRFMKRGVQLEKKTSVTQTVIFITHFWYLLIYIPKSFLTLQNQWWDLPFKRWQNA